jgi:hypothetical protein
MPLPFAACAPADNSIPALWGAAGAFPNLKKLDLRANFLWGDLPVVSPSAFAKVSQCGQQCAWALRRSPVGACSCGTLWQMRGVLKRGAQLIACEQLT